MSNFIHHQVIEMQQEKKHIRAIDGIENIYTKIDDFLW